MSVIIATRSTVRTCIAKRGISLIEILIAAALTAVLLTLLLSTLIPGWRLMLRGNQQIGQQQAALLVSRHLEADLRKTVPEGVTVTSEALVIHPQFGVSSRGREVWDRSLIVYHRVGESLFRKTWSPAAGLEFKGMQDRPQSLTAEQVQQVLSQAPSSSSLLIQKELKTWSFDWVEADRIRYQLQWKQNLALQSEVFFPTRQR